ncbi:MAG TPA: hypothetical protein VF814_15370 [Casimicrobiaceae bacterium]
MRNSLRQDEITEEIEVIMFDKPHMMLERRVGELARARSRGGA